MRKRKSETAQGRDRIERFQEEASMNSPIIPIPSNSGAAPVPAAAANEGASSAGHPSAPGGAAVQLESAVSLQALPSSPPAEVLDQMTQAAHRYAELSSQGRELRFVRDESSGRPAIEVRDRSGNLLKRLSPAEALDVAAGKPLD